MELAQRIKAARLAAGLSQRQLCGDTITRNMLSLIESGKARPSMETLGYFAARLGKPMSYFLDGEAAASANQKCMANAENAYGRKDFATTLALLEDYESPDPIFDNARYLLEYLSCVALAENALSEGKHKYAAALLERAENARVNTIYAPRREQLQLLRYQIEPACAGELEIAVDDALLIKAEGALLKNDPAAAVRYLGAMETVSARGQLLWGKAALLLEDFACAKYRLLLAEDAFPKEAIPLLEQVFLTLGDYKSAYEYAKKAQQ